MIPSGEGLTPPLWYMTPNNTFMAHVAQLTPRQTRSKLKDYEQGIREARAKGLSYVSIAKMLGDFGVKINPKNIWKFLHPKCRKQVPLHSLSESNSIAHTLAPKPETKLVSNPACSMDLNKLL